MTELATKSTYDTFPPNANDWDVTASDIETGYDHGRAEHVAAELGGAAVDDALSLVSSGSLEPSWHLRSASSDYSESKGNTGGSGGSIAEVGYQQGLRVPEVLIASPINGGDAKYISVADMDEDDKDLHGAHFPDEHHRVDFTQLSPEAKYSVLSGELHQIESDSRNREERRKSTLENIKRSELGAVVRPGEYLHGFDAGSLRSILNTGLVAGELTGHTEEVDGYDTNRGVPNVDAYPFNFDAWDAEAIPGVILQDSKMNIAAVPVVYGNVTAVIERDNDDVERDFDPVIKGGEDRLPDGVGFHGHKLIFAGVPATQIRALQLNPIPRPDYMDDAEFTEHRNTIVEELSSSLTNTLSAEGMYIPVYDDRGQLVFSYDDYVSRRKAGDYTVPAVHEPVTPEQRKKLVEAYTEEANRKALEDELKVDLSGGGV